jgi:hypothetical protein
LRRFLLVEPRRSCDQFAANSESERMPDRRALIPIVAGIVLVALCVWRVAANKPQDYSDQVAIRSSFSFSMAILEHTKMRNYCVSANAFLNFKHTT